MTLKIELRIEPTELAFQQDAYCLLTLTNIGKDTLTVNFPRSSNTMPVWKILDVATGQTRVIRRKELLFAKEFPVDLPPGQKLDADFKLLEKVAFEKPGEYELIAEYEWNGGQFRADSNPVRIKIGGWAPRYMDIVSLVGGFSVAQTVGFIQTSADASQWMMCKVDLYEKPAVQNLAPVQKIPSNVEPRMAIPLNQTFAERQWVAWLEGNRLQGFRLAGGKPDGKVVKGPDLPKVATWIVPPLAPVPEAGAVGDAAAAVLCQTTDKGVSNLQVGIIMPDGSVEPGPAQPLVGGTAIWGQGVAFTTGERRYYVVARKTENDAKKLTLQCVLWPAKAADMKAGSKIEIEGDLAACKVLLDASDKVHGALLARNAVQEGVPTMTLYTWRQDPKGEIELQSSHDLSLDSRSSFSEARLAVCLDGRVYAAINVDNNSWRWLSNQSDKIEPIPALQGFPGLVELVTMGMDVQVPLAMHNPPSLGLQFVSLDGKTLDQLAIPIIGG